MAEQRNASYEMTLEGGPLDGRTVMVAADSLGVRVGPVYKHVDELDSRVLHTYGWHRVQVELRVQPGREHVLVYGGCFSRHPTR